MITMAGVEREGERAGLVRATEEKGRSIWLDGETD